MKKLLLLSAILIGAAAASQAGISFNIGISLPAPRGIIISRPAPVYVPAPEVYAPPVCEPAPVYEPAPVCDPPTRVIVAPPVCEPRVVVAPRPVIVERPIYVPGPVYGHNRYAANLRDYRHDDWNYRTQKDDRRDWNGRWTQATSHRR